MLTSVSGRRSSQVFPFNSRKQEDASVELNTMASNFWNLGQLSWSTQFNDLRPENIYGSHVRERKENITFQLKKHALFDRTLVIRDADLVNSPELLSLINTDSEFIKTLIEDRSLVFALREGAASFSRVNDDAALKRAHPERYGTTKDLLPKFDEYLASNHTPLFEVSRKLSYDTFPKLLNKVLSSRRLEPFQEDLLQVGMKKVRESTSDAPMRFGELYDYLINQKKDEETDRLIQELLEWCRLAHVLTVPYDIGVPHSSETEDLRPDRIALILGHSGKRAQRATAPWKTSFLKLIPTEYWLRSLSFKRIVELRSHGYSKGYFEAADHLQRTPVNSPSFDDACQRYQLSLSEYIGAVRRDEPGDFVNLEEVAKQISDSKEFRDLMILRSPVLIGGFTSALIALTCHSHTAEIIAPSFTVGGAVLELALKRLRIRSNARTSTRL